MKKVVISSDSTCDLSKELIAKYDIKIIPMPITMGTDSYLDGVDATALDVFNFFETTGDLAKSSATPVPTYQEFFKKYTDEGYEVVHISLSSNLSATHNNSCLAAEDYEGCYCVDSKNLSTGIGLLVIEAATARDKGMAASEIAEHITALRDKVNASFVIDTLKYLAKGGRCSSVAALGANMLQLKPCIEVQDGSMSVTKKYRGKFSACLASYVSDRLKDDDNIDTSRIFVTHSHCSPEVVEMVKQEVSKYKKFDEILETTAGCTISVHCGPNTLGILYLNK